MDWNLWRPVTTSAQFAELQHGLDLSYKKLWSRDWKATEDTRVLDAYKLVRTSRKEKLPPVNQLLHENPLHL